MIPVVVESFTPVQNAEGTLFIFYVCFWAEEDGVSHGKFELARVSSESLTHKFNLVLTQLFCGVTEKDDIEYAETLDVIRNRLVPYALLDASGDQKEVLVFSYVRTLQQFRDSLNNQQGAAS